LLLISLSEPKILYNFESTDVLVTNDSTARLSRRLSLEALALPVEANRYLVTINDHHTDTGIDADTDTD
jgi:hypothetical protein